MRYLPAIDAARELRTNLLDLAGRARDAGLGIDRPTLDGLVADMAAERTRLDRLAGLLADDPLVAVARALPPTAADAHGADALVAAARDLFAAADRGLLIADRYVTIKDASDSSTDDSSTLAALVELMATTRGDALAAKAAVDRSALALDEVPDGPFQTLGGVRDTMREHLATYAPLLDGYVDASGSLPAMLGWDGPRRYLVLTQNPAELRPTGGYIGSYGILTFDRGAIAARSFSDVALLDFPWDYPYVEPPRALRDYLLGPGQPWQFADANWSPDFPTSARDALRLYENERGDGGFDGVIGITTYTIDELLRVTGPIDVPGYGATIASGETTLKTIQLTRVARPGENRKAFISAFADRLFDTLLSLPPDRWGTLIGQAGLFRERRLLSAWLRRPAEQRHVTDAGFDGSVRQDPGDFVYPVDANVAPASKLHAITTRRLTLDVTIDAFGDAHHELGISWDNPIDTEAGRPYRDLPTLEGLRILGVYLRLLVPEGSAVRSVEGGSLVPLGAPAEIGVEAGRMVVGNYVMVPPGTTDVRYAWTTPFPLEITPSGFRYRLTVQSQPGMRAGPLTLRIRVPDGFRVGSADDRLLVEGTTATADVLFDRDLQVALTFAGSAAEIP